MRMTWKTGVIVDMHVKEENGTIAAYYYQLREKLSLEEIASQSYADQENLRKNYRAEETHWLAFWGAQCPLPGVTREQLAAHPLAVQYLFRSSRHYDILSKPPLKNFRNINADKIILLPPQAG